MPIQSASEVQLRSLTELDLGDIVRIDEKTRGAYRPRRLGGPGRLLPAARPGGLGGRRGRTGGWSASCSATCAPASSASRSRRGWIEVLGVDPDVARPRRRPARWPTRCWRASAPGARPACAPWWTSAMPDVEAFFSSGSASSRRRLRPFVKRIWLNRDEQERAAMSDHDDHRAPEASSTTPSLQVAGDLSARLRLPARQLGALLPATSRSSGSAPTASAACRAEIECGDETGKPKYTRACDMQPEQAHHLARRDPRPGLDRVRLDPAAPADARPRPGRGGAVLGAAHDGRGAAPRLPDAPPAASSDDWTPVSGQIERADMVEEILSMRTGSHVLGAFNIDFDSFVDNIVFCALIDRVGKYQLAMQKVSRLPADGRDHAADAARGGVPPRRRRGAAAPLGGEGGARATALITMEVIQKALNKWLPRGLEMFGDERGGGTNVQVRPQADEERRGAGPVLRRRSRRWSATSTCATCARGCPDLDARRGRGGCSTSSRPSAARSRASRCEDLLRLPHRDFFRRRGVPAFTHGRASTARRFDDVERLPRAPRARRCPTAYLASRDFRDYVETLRAGRARRDDARGGAEAHAAAAPRRRRLPVLEVGALGGGRGGRAAGPPAGPRPPSRAAIDRHRPRDDPRDEPRSTGCSSHGLPLVPKAIVGRVAAPLRRRRDARRRARHGARRSTARARWRRSTSSARRSPSARAAAAAVEEYVRVLDAIAARGLRRPTSRSSRRCSA